MTSAFGLQTHTLKLSDCLCCQLEFPVHFETPDSILCVYCVDVWVVLQGGGGARAHHAPTFSTLGYLTARHYIYGHLYLKLDQI